MIDFVGFREDSVIRMKCQELLLLYDRYILKKKTRMTTFIKTKFKILDDQTNIDKQRLAENITEYQFILKLILQRIIIPIFIMIRQLFHAKYNLFGKNHNFYHVPNCIKTIMPSLQSKE